MDTILAIYSEEISTEKLHELTINLCHDIIKETDIDANMIEGISQNGAKGDQITIGLIALTLIKVGTVAALLNVLKSYLEIERSLKFTLKKNDDTELALTFKNLNREQIEETLEIIKNFMG